MSALYYLATAFLESGKPGEAEKLLALAEERGRDTEAPRYAALIESARAVCLGLLGDHRAAATALGRARIAFGRTKGEPALEATLGIHARTLRALERDGREDDTDATAQAEAHPSDDSRFALRMLSRALRKQTASSSGSLGSIVVAADGSGFRVPGATAWVDLSRRTPLRNVVRLLAEKRANAVGQVVGIHEIILAAWPGERISGAAALNRAYVALATLRKLGLRELLVTRGGGYLLTPAVMVEMTSFKGL
jgi:hypothetical protein